MQNELRNTLCGIMELAAEGNFPEIYRERFIILIEFDPECSIRLQQTDQCKRGPLLIPQSKQFRGSGDEIGVGHLFKIIYIYLPLHHFKKPIIDSARPALFRIVQETRQIPRYVDALQPY